MKIVHIIICLGISWFVPTMTNAAAGREAHYSILDSAKISVIDGMNAYWDYLGRPFDLLRTNQYGYMHPTTHTLHKRFYKTPAIHRYHGAGSVLQPIYFVLPPEAYENLPSSIKAIVPKDNIDIFFLVTVVQDWHETDGATRPLAVRPHHWNDPEAPYSSGDYSKSFADEVGIFDPSPPELKVNDTVNTLYAVTETTHQGDGMVISSGDSDHLVGGYTYTPGEQPHLDLCFWGVVKGPTPSGPRVAVTLHWVTSDHSLKAIKSLRNGMRIAEWVIHAEEFGIYAPCAERLCSLLGLPGKSTRRLSIGGGGAGAGSGTFGKAMGDGGLYGAHAEDDELARALSASLADQGRSRRSSSPRGAYATTLRGGGHGGAGASALSWERAASPRRGNAAAGAMGSVGGFGYAPRADEALRAVAAEAEAARVAAEAEAARKAAEDAALRAAEEARRTAEREAAERAAEARRIAEREAAEAAARAHVAPRMDVGGGAGAGEVYHLTIAADLNPAYQGIVEAKLEAMGGTGDPVREHNLVKRVRDHLAAYPTTTPILMKKNMLRW